MIPAILAALAVHYTQVFIPPGFRFIAADTDAADKLKVSLGNRDALYEEGSSYGLGPHGQRAMRAYNNLQESLPAFLALAILLHVQGDATVGMYAAWAFVAARALYVPIYIFGIFGLRTTMWTIGFVSLGVMAYDLLM